MLEESTILEKYKKAFNDRRSNPIIDLDKQIKEQLGCLLFRLEDILQMVGSKIPPFRQSRFFIVYVKSGSGMKTIGTHTFQVKNETLFIVPPRVIHSAQYGNDLIGYHLSFNIEFFLQAHFPSNYLMDNIIFNPIVHPYAYLKEEESKRLTDIYEIIFMEMQSGEKHKADLIALKILEILIICDRLLSSENKLEKISTDAQLLQFIILIDQFYKERHTLKFYAEKLHMHPNALNTLVKRQGGTSAKKMLEHKLIQESQYLLLHTSKNIKEISYDMGFHSPSYFFRFFKRNTGKSPAQYRMHPFEFEIK